MPTPMTDEQIQRTADFYGIDMDVARRRYEVIQAHTDDPEDPICVGCAKRPPEIEGYRIATMMHPDDEPTDEEITQYVIAEEGTYNPTNGHFLCDPCYIRNGQPSSSRGWRCP